MKKFISSFLIIILLSIVNVSAKVNNSDTSNYIYNNYGVVSIRYSGSTDKKIKVMIEKSGKKYYYNLNSMGEYECFPLQMGNGSYNISILENTSGISYRAVDKYLVKVSLENESVVYLNSIQNISWNESMDAIKKAKDLTINAKNDEEKVNLIYNYVISNLSYDHDKLNNIPWDYLPDIDDTIKNGKGICYDYSSLFASMLRSVDVPTKLIKGYSKNAIGYHAWNEVYISSQKKWIIVDTTYDSQLKVKKINASMIKNSNEYIKVSEY